MHNIYEDVLKNPFSAEDHISPGVSAHCIIRIKQS